MAVIKIRTLSIIICIIFICCFALFLPALAKPVQAKTHVIVIDAGHGGADGGAIGKTTGVKESDLNLKYALCLESYLKSAGFDVVQTRTSQNSLVDFSALGAKQKDMQERKRIIEKAKPNMVISIHMNKFSMEYVKGAQTFYQENDQSSERLARNIQSLFVTKLNSPKTLHLQGDYFICKCYNCPSVIVECGFLSNPEEEQLLINDDYMDKVCYNIFCGVIKYLVTD